MERVGVIFSIHVAMRCAGTLRGVQLLVPSCEELQILRSEPQECEELQIH